MKRIYSGPTGSGKTTKLQKKYHQIGQQVKTDECLVLVNKGTNATKWRQEIKLTTTGLVNIFTYFGFVNQEVTRYWDLIEENLSGGRKVLKPTFMTVEPTHYLMTSFVEQAREQGNFIEVSATAQQIALQLINNLNYAALNGLELSEVKDRLNKWAKLAEQKDSYQAGFKLMKRFREVCLKQRCLDYSLVVDLYNKYLLSNQKYNQDLKERFNYLFVDDLEKMVPTAQDVIKKLLPEVDEAYLSFNPEGGFEKFFGAAPQLAKEYFFSQCELVELEEIHTASLQAREMATKITDKILTGAKLSYNDFVQQDQLIKKKFRGEMLLKVANEIDELIKEGVNPHQIAIIAPQIDKILEFVLEKEFKKDGHSLLNLRRDRRLLDNRFAQALIVLTILVNPDWELELNFSSLVQTLGLILKLDPIRAGLLANRVIDKQLPDLEENPQLRARLGFDDAKRYDDFKAWITDKRATDFELEYFFREAFGELLSPLLAALADESEQEEVILSCRKIMDSIVKFKKVVSQFKDAAEEDIGYKFIEMINQGTVAAELLFGKQESEDKVILATPYSFLSLPDVDKVEYLFLLDLSSELWLLGSGKELSNPYVLSRQTEGEWGDKIDQKLRYQQLADYLQSILSKVTKGLYLADSDLSSRGWQQEGQLSDWLQEDQTEVINNG
ncbi:hypothetical protein Halha_1564 [Halobacteroides halobius DSM 5150]|uniref:UvrD-like helicase ATP-binding domain-containing protein n=1 Tax=Halobacteroides halobius (strain ATCC 35273 / DSM 5150 / MD-1) TaxID=748449 RepID=L0KBP0_HALHC|nr:UvrD-helicase domain-containing protein [Halobacteroides halobius]AGB41503.1 hypothetical protein Halha_1564 [Halobacteroides halobius DSM 5150]